MYDKKLNTFHLSSLSMWVSGKNKGRLSIYLPLKEFVDRGHKVFYLTNRHPQKNDDICGIIIERVCPPLSIKIKKLQVVTNLLTLPLTTLLFFLRGVKLSKDYKPDVIYAHTTDMAFSSFLLAKYLKSKYVLRLYGVGNWKKLNLIKKVVRLDLYLAFKLKADLYILTNDGTSADKLAKSYGVPMQKVHFWKNGVNKTWSKLSNNELLRRSLAPNSESIILSVSRLVESKQVHIIIHAFENLLKLNNQIKLVIVGDGVEEANLKNMVKRKKINNNVVFVGPVRQSEVVNYMQIADIFVSMNVLSSMCNPVIEAMICELPVVALNKGNTEELIQHNYNGILIEPNNIKILPFVLNELIINNKKRCIIGKNAQKYITNKWPSWEERVNKEINLIENLY